VNSFYYAWLCVLTDIFIFRPFGIKKCKQIAITLKLCHWIEISIAHSLLHIITYIMVLMMFRNKIM